MEAINNSANVLFDLGKVTCSAIQTTLFAPSKTADRGQQYFSQQSKVVAKSEPKLMLAMTMFGKIFATCCIVTLANEYLRSPLTGVAMSSIAAITPYVNGSNASLDPKMLAITGFGGMAVTAIASQLFDSFITTVGLGCVGVAAYLYSSPATDASAADIKWWEMLPQAEKLNVRECIESAVKNEHMTFLTAVELHTLRRRVRDGLTEVYQNQGQITPAKRSELQKIVTDFLRSRDTKVNRQTVGKCFGAMLITCSVIAMANEYLGKLFTMTALSSIGAAYEVLMTDRIWWARLNTEKKEQINALIETHQPKNQPVLTFAQLCDLRRRLDINLDVAKDQYQLQSISNRARSIITSFYSSLERRES